ncbi:hypothetical protein ACFL7D_00300 [candidate division KSB1 bacterium]
MRNLSGKIFLGLSDPNMSDLMFQKFLNDIQGVLKRRARIDTQQWLVKLADRLK